MERAFQRAEEDEKRQIKETDEAKEHESMVEASRVYSPLSILL